MAYLAIKSVLLSNSAEGQPETRRFRVDEDVASNFGYLQEKIKQMYPNLRYTAFDMFWKDCDAELITISCDEELIDALGHVDDGIFKLYLKKSAPARENNGNFNCSEFLHHLMQAATELSENHFHRDADKQTKDQTNDHHQATPPADSHKDKTEQSSSDQPKSSASAQVGPETLTPPILDSAIDGMLQFISANGQQLNDIVQTVGVLAQSVMEDMCRQASSNPYSTEAGRCQSS